MTPARKSSRTRLKGRSQIAIGLIVFMVISGVVVWRRSIGVANAKSMQVALTEKRALLSERSALERDIDNAQKREHVIVEAERRLGLHVATDAQTRVLPMPVDSL